MMLAELRPKGIRSGTPHGKSPFVGIVSSYLKEVNKIAHA